MRDLGIFHDYVQKIIAYILFGGIMLKGTQFNRRSEFDLWKTIIFIPSHNSELLCVCLSGNPQKLQ